MKKSKKISLISALGTTAIAASAAVTIAGCSTNTPDRVDSTISIYGVDDVYHKAGGDATQEKYSVTIEPLYVAQDVVWDYDGTLPDNSYFENGILTIDSSEIQSTTITIVATSKVDSTVYAKKEVNISVVEANVRSVSIKNVTPLQPGNIYKTNQGLGGAVQFQGVAEPEEASQEFKFTPISGFDAPTEGTITLDETSGLVSWDKDVKPKRDDQGEIIPYPLTFKATSVASPEFSSEFTLNLYVDNPLVEDVVAEGQLVINTSTKTSGTIQYSAKVIPEDIPEIQSVDWYIQDSEAWRAGLIKVDNKGVLTYNPNKNAEVGTYKGIVVAESTADETKNAALDITINIYQSEPTSITTTVPSTVDYVTVGTAGQLKVTDEFNATVLPNTAIQEVTWYTSDLPKGFSLEGNTIKWTADTVKGTYPVDVWAKSKSDSSNVYSEKKTINITVDNPKATQINITKYPATMSALQNVVTTFQCEASIQPALATKDVSWELEPLEGGDPIPSGVSIDPNTGLLKCNVATFGNYEFNVVATTTDGTSLSDRQKVSLEVTYDPVLSIDITGKAGININYGDSGEEVYTSTTFPNSAPTAVVWTIDGETPTGVNLVDNQNGTATLQYNKGADKVSKGEHKIVLKATSNYGTGGNPISQTFNVLLNVDAPAPQSIDVIGDTNPITLNQGETFTRVYTATVNPDGSPQGVKWILDNAPAGNHITLDEKTGVLSYDGQLASSATSYSITFHAVSEIDGNIKSDNQTITLTVNQRAPSKVTISGNSAINIVSGIAGNNTSYSALVDPSQASQAVTWHNANLPTGVTQDSSTGELTWDTSVKQGTYTATVWATSNVVPTLTSNVMTITFDVAYHEVTDVEVKGADILTMDSNFKAESTYTAEVLPLGTNQEVTWYIDPAVTGANIDANTGKFTYTGTSAASQTVTIWAKSVQNPSATGYMTVNINPTPAQSITISGDQNISIDYGASVVKTYTATVNPTGSSQIVTWSVENLPLGADFDTTTGTLKVNEAGSEVKTPPGDYTFNIKATSNNGTGGTTIEQTHVVQLHVAAEAATTVTVIGDTSAITTTEGTKVTRQFSAVVSGASGAGGCYQDVTWITENNPDQGISIDSNTGLLTVDTNTAAGSHSITFHATTTKYTGDQKSSDSITINITVNAPAPSTITIDTDPSGTTELNVDPTATNKLLFKAEGSPSGSASQFIWTVSAVSGTLPDGVYMQKVSDNTANLVANKVTITDDIDVNVTAISVANPSVQSTPMTITLSGPAANTMVVSGTTYKLADNIDVNTVFCGSGNTLSSVPLKKGDPLTNVSKANITSLQLTSVDTTQGTVINNYCFDNFSNMTEITLPEEWQVTEIGSHFLRNSALTTLTIPDTWHLTKVGGYFMYHLQKLENLTLPSSWSVTSLENSFYELNNLKSLTLPEYVSSNSNADDDITIGQLCFNYLNTLTTLTIPDSWKLASLGYNLFAYNSKLETLNLSSNITAISFGSHFGYSNPSLKSFTLPPCPNVSTIYYYFLNNCSSLETLDLSNLTYNGCTINMSQGSQQPKFLAGCTKLKEVTLPNYSSTIPTLSVTWSDDIGSDSSVTEFKVICATSDQKTAYSSANKWKDITSIIAGQSKTITWLPE